MRWRLKKLKNKLKQNRWIKRIHRYIFLPYLLLWRHRKYLFFKTRQDLRVKYAGSILGMAWMVLVPLMFLGLYSTVQIFVHKIERPNMTAFEFAVMMFCGLMSIFGTTEALMNGTRALPQNKTLLHNSSVPAEILVAQAGCFGFMTCLVGVPIAMIVSFVHQPNNPFLLIMPFMLFFQLTFSVGLCWIFSILGTIIKDIQFMLRFMTLGLLIVSPVAYTANMVPEHLSFLIYFNPVAYFILSYQSLVVFGQLPAPEFLLGAAGLSTAVFLLGFGMLHKLKRAMIDYM